MKITYVMQESKSVHRVASATRIAAFFACAVALCLGSIAPSRAKDFCVSSGPDLQNALLEAQDNGTNDVIKLRSGIPGGYVPPLSNGFVAVVTDFKSITIEGGYASANCPLQGGGAKDTVINGNPGSGVVWRRLMNIVFANTPANTAPSTFRLSNVTLTHGKGTADTAPVIRVKGIAGGWRGLLVLENVSVRDNEMDGAAVELSTQGDIVIRNSEFVNNEGVTNEAWPLHLTSNGTGDANVYFINNTVAANTGPDQNNEHAVYIDARNNVYVHNSIIRSGVTESRGLMFGGSHIEVANSSMDYIFLSNIQTTISEHDQRNSIPVFVSPSDFHLVAPTPLIHGGNLDAEGFGVGLTDISGAPRTVGPVDVGAYECQGCPFSQVPEIFSDGFEGHGMIMPRNTLASGRQ